MRLVLPVAVTKPRADPQGRTGSRRPGTWVRAGTAVLGPAIVATVFRRYPLDEQAGMVAAYLLCAWAGFALARRVRARGVTSHRLRQRLRESLDDPRSPGE